MGQYWLLKSEPQEWSWDDQAANGGVSHWDGVRNPLAQKHLRAMALGDLCFFYHSGPSSKHIVGITRVCKSFYPDPSDPTGKHGMVNVEAVSQFPRPVPLSLLRQQPSLKDFVLLRQPRLSVMPVSNLEWTCICHLADSLVASEDCEEEERLMDNISQSQNHVQEICAKGKERKIAPSDDVSGADMKIDDTISGAEGNARKKKRTQSRSRVKIHVCDGRDLNGCVEPSDFQNQKILDAKGGDVKIAASDFHSRDDVSVKETVVGAENKGRRKKQIHGETRADERVSEGRRPLHKSSGIQTEEQRNIKVYTKRKGRQGDN